MQSIPIYIISLKRTPERRLYIQRQLDALRLEYQWIEAVDAYNLKESELNNINKEGSQYSSLTNRPNAMGCLLSHVKFYDQVIKNGHEIACVLEDDAQLLPSFPSVLKSEKLQSKKWNILLLAHQTDIVLYKFLYPYYAYIKNNQKRCFPYDQYVLGALPSNFSQKICEGHYIAKPKASIASTMGYLIRLSAAKKLKEIALAYKDYVYIDDITGNERVSEVSTKLITPPCIRISFTYTKYSLIEERLPIPKPSKLPDEALLHSFMRNKWTTIIVQLLMLKRTRLMLKFIGSLIHIEWEKFKKYFIPNGHYNERILAARKHNVGTKR